MNLDNISYKTTYTDAWGGRLNITRKGRDSGIPPSVEHLMLKVNNSLNGVPPFCYTDIGKVIEPPVKKGFEKLPEGISKTVVIIGAGLGGLISALELVKLGYSVNIYEAKDYIGGRLGAEPLKASPSGVWEHGLHHFFVNVYDFLIQKMEEVGAYTDMAPVNDVYIQFENYEDETLKVFPNAHILNLLGILFRSPNVTLLDAIKSIRGLLPVFFYNHEKIIDKYDDLTMREYAQRTGISRRFYDTFINTVLTVSINRMTDISAAQVLHLMWVFFLCRPDAMQRMVPTDNHYFSIIQPFLEHLKKLDVNVYPGQKVQSLEIFDKQVKGINLQSGERVECDYLVLATDIRGAQTILNQTQSELHDQLMAARFHSITEVVNRLKIAPPYIVARAYFTQEPNDIFLPDVIETPENQPVDLVFQPHKTERKAAKWIKSAPPGEKRWILELHGYDLGPYIAPLCKISVAQSKALSDEELWVLIKELSDEQLWDVLKKSLRHIDGLENMADAPLYPEGGLQLRRFYSFTGFQPGQGNRLSPSFSENSIENMVAVGDWVAIQGKNDLEGNTGQIHPGGNLMGHTAVVAGVAAGIIASKDNVVGPYVPVI